MNINPSLFSPLSCAMMLCVLVLSCKKPDPEIMYVDGNEAEKCAYLFLARKSLRPEVVIPHILVGLNDSSATVRVRTAYTLMCYVPKYNSYITVPTIRRQLVHESDIVAKCALIQLVEKMGKSMLIGCIEELITCANGSSDNPVSSCAVDAIRNIAPELELYDPKTGMFVCPPTGHVLSIRIPE